MEKDQISFKVIHPHAAGIDVGSREHFVAIGQGLQDVKSFGVYAEDLSSLAQWLLDNKITTVAMESTGAYWQNLFVELINNGLDVVLTNGKFTKNINRKKTDVLDCQCLPAAGRDTKDAFAWTSSFQLFTRSYHRKTQNTLPSPNQYDPAKSRQHP